ncbi:MAG: hypothetical protein LBV48_02285 [Mycoplasmataceae bacterium]|nr:hypothetical protein [Mycoplasmataceae bacterium]
MKKNTFKKIPNISMPVVGKNKSISAAEIATVQLSSKKRIVSIGCAKIYNTKKDTLLEKYQKDSAALKANFEKQLEIIEDKFQNDLAKIDSMYK